MLKLEEYPATEEEICGKSYVPAAGEDGRFHGRKNRGKGGKGA